MQRQQNLVQFRDGGAIGLIFRTGLSREAGAEQEQGANQVPHAEIIRLCLSGVKGFDTRNRDL